MVIQFGGINTGPFGGPAGGLQKALLNVAQQFQVSQAKKQKEQDIASIGQLFKSDEQLTSQQAVNRLLSSGLSPTAIERFLPVVSSAFPKAITTTETGPQKRAGQLQLAKDKAKIPGAGLTGDAKNFFAIKGFVPTAAQLNEFRKESKPVAASPLTKLLNERDNLKGLTNPRRAVLQRRIDQLSKEPGVGSEAELVKKALGGDQEAADILEEMVANTEKKSFATTQGKFDAIYELMDIPGVASRIIAGDEIIDNVKNVFGLPIQEIARAEVLKQDPTFNFTQPRAIFKSLTASLQQQQKNRGTMGSFVTNINDQVSKLETMSKDIVKRVGIRALDFPIRSLRTRFIGSGHENVFAAFMKEISAEINKLSQGSTASVAQLPEENRKEWEKIHDVNLSMKELLIVLNGTRDMANIRLSSVDDEIDKTIDLLGDVRKKRTKTTKPKSRFKIIRVED